MSDWLEIHALADNELSAEEKAQLEAKLRTCEQSKREYETVLNLKDLLQTRVEPQTCTRTWTQCKGRLKELEQRQRVERFVTRYAWGLCGGIFVVLVGGAWFNRASGNEVRTGDVARMVAGIGPTSRQSGSDPEELKNWLPANRRTLPTINLGDLQVMGIGKGHYHGLPYAIFEVNDKGAQMELIVIDGVDRVEGLESLVENPQFQAGMMGQRNCVSWKDRDFTLILMGDRTTTELTDAARQVDID